MYFITFTGIYYIFSLHYIFLELLHYYLIRFYRSFPAWISFFLELSCKIALCNSHGCFCWSVLCRVVPWARPAR